MSLPARIALIASRLFLPFFFRPRRLTRITISSLPADSTLPTAPARTAPFVRLVSLCVCALLALTPLPALFPLMAIRAGLTPAPACCSVLRQPLSSLPPLAIPSVLPSSFSDCGTLSYSSHCTLTFCPARFTLYFVLTPPFFPPSRFPHHNFHDPVLSVVVFLPYTSVLTKHGGHSAFVCTLLILPGSSFGVYGRASTT